MGRGRSVYAWRLLLAIGCKWQLPAGTSCSRPGRYRQFACQRRRVIPRQGGCDTSNSLLYVLRLAPTLMISTVVCECQLSPPKKITKVPSYGVVPGWISGRVVDVNPQVTM